MVAEVQLHQHCSLLAVVLMAGLCICSSASATEQEEQPFKCALWTRVLTAGKHLCLRYRTQVAPVVFTSTLDPLCCGVVSCRATLRCLVLSCLVCNGNGPAFVCEGRGSSSPCSPFQKRASGHAAANPRPPPTVHAHRRPTPPALEWKFEHGARRSPI